jgi:serine phosphatase RsbU (regulator of sigma subunit)/ligand-binding sensor domain-containing protein
MIRHYLYIIFLLSFGFNSVAQNDYQYGKLNVKNFSTNEYKAVAQNWDIIQNDEGFIFIANNSSILMFDGVHWNKVENNNRSSATSFAKNENGDIFVGGDKEFGKIIFNEKGKFEYQELSSNLPDSLLNDIEKIWKTYYYDNTVHFVSKKVIYSMSKTGKFTITPSPKSYQIDNSFQFGNSLLFYLKNENDDNDDKEKAKHCVVWRNGAFQKIENTKDLSPNGLFKSNQLYYLVTNTGVIIELINSQDSVHTKNINIDLIFDEKLNINCVAAKNNIIAIGTAGDGILLFNLQGELIRTIKEDDGLVNLEIRRLYFDKENNLWSCNDNGLTFIELSSPITSFNKNQGIISATEDMYFSENGNYLATRTDLFKENVVNHKKVFENTDVFQMETFQMRNFTFSDGTKKTLIIANDGVYEFKDGKKILIAELWAWDLSQSTSNPDKIWVGLDGEGVTSLTYKNKKLTIDTESYKNTSGEVRQILELNGTVYYTVKDKGLHHLDTTVAQENNVISDGLVDYKSDKSTYQQFAIEIFNNTLYVGTDNGLYYLKENELIPFSGELNKQDLKIHRFYNDNNEKLWLALFYNSNKENEKPEVGYIDFTQEVPVYKSNIFKAVSKEAIQSIDKDNNGILWFASNKEIFTYNSKTQVREDNYFQAFISMVRDPKDTLSYYTNYSKKQKHSILYDNNAITFDYTSTSFSGVMNNEYNTYLEGLEDTWTGWTPNNSVTFPRLNEGKYTFHLKSKNYYGTESKETSFEFTILPPWYRTWWAYIIYFVIIILLIYLVVKMSIRRVKQQNEKLELIVEERTAEVELQKHEIEEKNKDIVDSIKYAKRIQNTILPTTDRLNNILKDYFVIYKPKDIVSGDFYWADKLDGKSYFSAIDCTGHGVPGAFVSIVGFNGLKRTVNEFKLRTPSKILDKLTDLVIETFSASDSHLKDGMDLALCSLDYETLMLEYSGANNPLILIRDGEIIETKGNKQPIGDFEHRVDFENHEVQLQKGDNIYLFSDGYADQFGGPKGKKFKLKTLKNLLLEVSVLEPSEQKQKLIEAFNEWKGELEQLDDVCLIGVKI